MPPIDWSVPPDPQEIEQLCDIADWPLWDRLDWLEEAQLIVESLQAAHERRMAQTSNLT